MKIFGGSNKTENNRSKLMGCCEGKVAELKETDDDIISSGILGEGYAVYPKMNEFEVSFNVSNAVYLVQVIA